MFLFLNKTCFRGLFRVGPNGFNVPYGHYKKPNIVEWEHLEEIHYLIQRVHFICCDFNTSLSNIATSGEAGTKVAKPVLPQADNGGSQATISSQAVACCKQEEDKNPKYLSLIGSQDTQLCDYIYLDPPYASDKTPLKASPSSFVGYTKKGFGEKEHIELFNLCDKLTYLGLRNTLLTGKKATYAYGKEMVTMLAAGRASLPAGGTKHIKMMMSNADVSSVRAHFSSKGDTLASRESDSNVSPYYIQAINCRRAINSKNPAMTAKELIIKNYL